MRSLRTFVSSNGHATGGTRSASTDIRQCRKIPLVNSIPTFEWDEAKAEENHRKHRVTFQFAARAFADQSGLDLTDDRMDYGEERWMRIAMVEGRLICVAYTQRAEVHRLISARPATRRERRMYHG